MTKKGRQCSAPPQWAQRPLRPCWNPPTPPSCQRLWTCSRTGWASWSFAPTSADSRAMAPTLRPDGAARSWRNEMMPRGGTMSMLQHDIHDTTNTTNCHHHNQEHMHGVGRNKENGLSEVLNWEKALVLGVRKKADPQQGKDYKQISSNIHCLNDFGDGGVDCSEVHK